MERAMNGTHSTVAEPVAKILSAWGVVGLSYIVEMAQLVASVLAAVYTVLLIGEWCWKKFGRSFAERRGWAKRRKRRQNDDKEE